jgi:tetratricopeptide (TPR) repeat protein
VALIALAGPASAQSEAETTREYDKAKEYADCMTLAAREPEQALESARQWEISGGAEAAKHCAAAALMGLGEYAKAAEEFEDLAKHMPTDKLTLVPQLLRNAGQAWTAAGDLEKAHVAQTEALKLAPRDVDLLVDRAMTRGLAQNYWEAIDDLNVAHDLAPKREDILVFRAGAYRYVDSLDLAQQDIEEALELDPEDPDALLERARIRIEMNDSVGARDDLVKVANLAHGKPAGDEAQELLEKLDLKTQ